MAPTKLKELKAQLKKMVEAEFSRPSKFTWGGQVLFVKEKIDLSVIILIIDKSIRLQSKIGIYYQRLITSLTSQGQQEYFP